MAANSRHLLDPELVAILDQLPAIPVNRETLEEIRSNGAQQIEALRPTLPEFPGIEVSESQVPRSDESPAVRVLFYRPIGVEQSLPALLWIHGGGYVAGRADGDGGLVKSLVDAVGCCVVSVDYRLAPETPFPGAVEDCYAALHWLYTNASAWRIDREHIGIAGMSAGGGLAASLGLLARDRGEVKLCLQALLQPMLDDRQATDAYAPAFAGEYVWRKESNHFDWLALLGREPGSEGVSPYASAARAESLAGLPPSFINIGALDLFIEENMEYARRLIRDGVPTELHVYPGTCHAFQLLAPDSALARAQHNDFITALKRALARAS